MNAISRPATMQEIEHAAEIIIPEAELNRLWAQAQEDRAKEAKQRSWANVGRLSLLLGLAGVAIAEGVALAALAPLVRVEPVFVYQRDDGTALSSTSWKDMPANVREASLMNVLAEYVRLREGWSSGEAARAWDVVSALSTKQVREQFQAWYRKENPESPQRIYGDRSTLRVVVTDIRPEPTPGAYRIYYNAITRTPEGDGRPAPMVASLRIRDLDNPKRLPWHQRVQFNGPGIAVWEYPGAVPNGASSR